MNGLSGNLNASASCQPANLSTRTLESDGTDMLNRQNMHLFFYRVAAEQDQTVSTVNRYVIT